MFDQVQSVLYARAERIGERERKHHHYLKSTVWCGRCHDAGRESRLILTRAIGRRGGEYWHFMCSARPDHLCDLPHLAVEDVEARVIDHYATLRLPGAFAARVRSVLAETLADEQGSARQVHDHLNASLKALDRQEDNLLDLVADGGTAAPKVRARLVSIGEERARIQAELAKSHPDLEAGAEIVRAALDLLNNTQELYRQTTDTVRRQLNQVFFERLYVDLGGR